MQLRINLIQKTFTFSLLIILLGGISSCKKDENKKKNETTTPVSNPGTNFTETRIYVVFDEVDLNGNTILNVKLDNLVLHYGKVGTQEWDLGKVPPPASLPENSSNPYLCLSSITYGNTLSGQSTVNQRAFNVSELQPGLNILKIVQGNNGYELTPYLSGIPTGISASVNASTINNITSTGFTSGGFSINSNGNTIIEKGVCWSTSTTPTRANFSKVSGSGTSDFTVDVDNLLPMTTYHVRAFVTVLDRTYYSENEFTFTTELGTLTLGQSVAGGIVAYILQPGDYGYNANQQHGFIVKEDDLYSCPWGCVGTMVGNTFGQIGYGQQNTNILLNSCPTYNGQVTAAATCDNLIEGGYNDWYLPSFVELQQIYAVNSIVNLNLNVYSTYWSSTELSTTEAFGVKLYTGEYQVVNKGQSLLLRPIRSF